MAFNVNGFRDRSDTQATQLTTRIIFNPAFARPVLTDAPFAPDKARAADWGADNPMRFDTRFWQTSGRIDYELSDVITLTSLTSYSDLKVNTFNDGDGTAADNVDNQQQGYFKSFNQELRISGSTDRINWILGASYQRDRALDSVLVSISDNTLSFPVQAIPGFENVPQIAEAIGRTRQKIRNEAVFGNLEYKLTEALTAQLGARYTKSTRRGNACSVDALPTNATGQNFEALQQLFIALGVKTTPFVPIAAGQCYILDAGLSPDLDGVDEYLSEDNLSWRAGLNYKFEGGTLAYANISRGYKAGAIPQINASATSAFEPAVQERVDAYELGFKAPLLGGRAHLNAAGFYYDYRNKQIRGSVRDPIFGTLERLVNVPKSRVWGKEADLTAEVVDGLFLTGGVTYINTKVVGAFPAFNREGIAADYGGSRLPYSPKLTGNGDIQYEWALSNGAKPFVGASVAFHSSDNSTFRTQAVPATAFDIKAYTTLDLRAGIAAPDDRWRVMVFGRNITNEFYWLGTTQAWDTFTRSAARPATYGITLSIRTN